VRKLRAQGAIGKGDRVVIVLTGAGLKDLDVVRHHSEQVLDCAVDELERRLGAVIESDAALRPSRYGSAPPR